MNRHRLRIWNGLRLLLAGALLCVATIFFVTRVTPRLSDLALFLLKLVSFSVTAAFGFAGFITEFKDQEKNLTTSGKLNLAGLVVAAAIGITVQTGEYINNTKAEGKAREESVELRRQNETLLNQVNRSLDPIGETIAINYDLMIPLAQSAFQGYADLLQKQMIQLTSATPTFYSEHANVLHLSQPSQPERYLTKFDRDSSLMPGDQYPRQYLAQPPFGISFYMSRPVPLAGCANTPPTPDMELMFDDRATADHVTPDDQGAPKWKGISLGYDTKTANYVSQLGEGIFQIRNKNQNLVGIHDLSQSYMRLFSVIPGPHSPPEFKYFTITIAQRPFAIPPTELVPDNCGMVTYRLPTITPSTRRTPPNVP